MKYYTKKILKIVYVAQIISSVIVLSLLPVILNIYNLSAQATMWTEKLVWCHAIVMMLIWPLAYTLPITSRASGDAKFPMIISILAMCFCRIALSYVFAIYFNMGVFGTWVAMFTDWILKAIIFVGRYLKGKWMTYRSI